LTVPNAAAGIFQASAFEVLKEWEFQHQAENRDFDKHLGIERACISGRVGYDFSA